MNTANKNNSRYTVGIACGIFFFTYAGCYHHLLNSDINQHKYKEEKPHVEISKDTSNIYSGQRTLKTIKRLRVIPTTETYEVSRWVTSGDWSHDRDELSITIPSQRVIMDIDYVEDHWDDYISDPEDEILYPPEIFQ